ncbi:hypothetical protein EXIGLDRAFT_841895 [Exidia glandulosa HHB12029]|uniref:Uncharacterized protein n=1 Tax=Exidia glandulosa HHB12029 TaxID=1314781 RepID=A0A165DLG5_EXIGL|nr:hypothetical protein EXIGLDRAFT_841895 [Exidia glandulosa HHB12029]
MSELYDYHDSSSQAASPENTDRPPIGYSPATSASEDTDDPGPDVHGSGITQALQGDIVPTTRALVPQQDTASMAVGVQPFCASPAHSGGTLPAGNVDTHGLYTSVYTPFVHAQVMAAANIDHADSVVAFEGGQYTSFYVFAGHGHLASDLGFVFNHDVADSNDSGASVWPSDMGEVFGDVQYTAEDTFGADYEDSVTFESDLGFAF